MIHTAWHYAVGYTNKKRIKTWAPTWSAERRNSGRDFKCLHSNSNTVAKWTDIHEGRWKHKNHQTKQNKETNQKNQISTSGFAIDSGKSSWHKFFQYRWDNQFPKTLSQVQRAKHTKWQKRRRSKAERPITKSTNFASLPKHFARRAISRTQSWLYSCWHCQKLTTQLYT